MAKREMSKPEYEKLARQLVDDGTFNMMVEDIVVWRKHGRQASVRAFYDEKSNELTLYSSNPKAIESTYNAIVGGGASVRGRAIAPPTEDEIQGWLVGQIPRVHALPGGEK